MRRFPLLAWVLLPVALLLGACGDGSRAGSGAGSGAGSDAAGNAGAAGDGGGRPDVGPEVTDVTGAWGDTATPDAPSLEFAGDGRVSGTDGCNRLFGEWSIQGSRVTLQNMASTKMYCHDVDDWLSGGVAADVDGDTLRIYDVSGAEIGVLRR